MNNNKKSCVVKNAEKNKNIEYVKKIIKKIIKIN